MNRLALVLAVSVLVIGALIWQWSRGRSGDPDEAVIRALRDAGSDTTRPTSIRFYLYFPDEPRAKVAAERVRRERDEITLEKSAYDNNWLCLITRTMTPNHSELSSLRREFSAVTADLDGEYDGWEAAVVK